MKKRQILCGVKRLGQVARKTKTSKKTQENGDSKDIESVETADEATLSSTDENESELTAEVSETSDTPEPQENVDEALDETPQPDEVEEVSAASDAEDATDSEETPSDAESEGSGASDATEDMDAADEGEPVDTTVAGVVPAQAEPVRTEPVAPPKPAPAPAPSAFPLVLGGLIAGAAGFLIATFAVPEGWPNPPSDAPVVASDPETTARVESLSGELAALTERLDNLPEPTTEVVATESVDLTPLIDRLDTIEGETGGLRDAISSLEQAASELSARVDEIAERPAIVSPDGSAAMEAQLETFRRDLDAVTEAARAEIEEAQSRASQIEAEAAAAAADAARNAAMADIRAALESGEPFADALGALGDAPDALTSVATEGVASMASLQNGFPDAARSALQEVQTVPEDASTADRMASFLRRHTNARSLAPREGDDPDAVLSRAEAALASGDVPAALAELDALPDDAKAALQDWIDAASARANAVAAMNEME